MPYPPPQFPGKIWDGLSANRNRTNTNRTLNPNSDDWDRIAAEVISTQETQFGGTLQSIENIDTDPDWTNLTSGGVKLLDATFQNLLIVLPPATNFYNGVVSKSLLLKRIDGTVNTIVIDGFQNETIDGDITRDLNFQYASLSLLSNGVGWFIV